MTIVGGPQKLIRIYDAVAANVPEARRELSDFARAAGASDHELYGIRIAISEALTNVVLHAYRGTAGRLYVNAALAGDELWVLIGDDGPGLHAGGQSTGLGIGLALIAELSDSFSVVNRSEGGTEVRMRFALQRQANPRPPHSLRGSAASAIRPAAPFFSTTK